MKVAIVGYGGMGHEVEKILKTRGHKYITIDVQDNTAQFKELKPETLSGIEAAIDFTLPKSVLENVKTYASAGTNVVIGTTGWGEHLQEVKKIVSEAGTGMIWSSNFSVGVNLFYQMVEAAAQIADNVPEYDVFLHELHHNRKQDSPSGTAKTLANLLLKNIRRKKKAVYDKLDRRIEPDELHVSSTRGGFVPGTHIVSFDSEADTIELKHTARSRQGFALGAVLAAEFIKGKKGCFEIGDLMENIVRRTHV
ncbi:MAG: 4-hydroxy-tetrahydrodipicolinate reductase [Candidatus Wallbacteria bacterium]|nr:4-hydroxy-tetrahydrodipicolinate reductase [Candidatus Wallbacteria bacterium]